VVVADRGLLSLDNIEALRSCGGRRRKPLEFILAVPGRRYGEFVEILEPMNARAGGRPATRDRHEAVARPPPGGGAQPGARPSRPQERLASAHPCAAAAAEQLAGKLDAQDEGKVQRGRKLSDSRRQGALLPRGERCPSGAHHQGRPEVRLCSPIEIDESAGQAQLMDGKLMLVTNVQDMAADEVVQRYKALADIERGFRVLKSEIEIAPVFHRLPERIKAHASICFMALILYRVMRQRLKLAGSELSPEAALADLRRIQRHTVSIDSAAPIHGVSTVQPRQAQALAALKHQETDHRHPTDACCSGNSEGLPYTDQALTTVGVELGCPSGRAPRGG
jgi:hypothetical protein